jgi:pyruvate kinase
MPNTKIVATLGPASDSPAILSSLLEAGVDVFRLNASHGNWEDHARRIERVRTAAGKAGKHTGILLDLQGPKIRLGKFERGSCCLKAGSRFVITTENVLGNDECASTGYADLARDVGPGNRVLLADGAVELRALSTDGHAVTFEVILAGPSGITKASTFPVSR